MENLLFYFNLFNTYSKANPIVAGVVSLWGVGVVTWMLRSVPMKIYRFLKDQFTTTLTFNNNQQGTNAETFSSFLMWFEKSPWVKWSRNMALIGTHYGHHDNNAALGTIVGIGDGSHFFMYKGRPFWMNRTRLSQGTNQYQMTYEVKMTILGRNRQVILDLVDEFKYQPPADKLGIYNYTSHDWARVKDTIPRKLSTVIINTEIKEKIIRDIEVFLKSRDWYLARGLSYKLTIILHGKSGSGKSSLIKGIASHFNMGLATVKLNSMNDEALEHALATVDKKNIVAMEDFDSAAAVNVRKAMRNQQRSLPSKASQASSSSKHSDDLDEYGNSTAQGQIPPENTSDKKEDFFGLTLSGILNALDGVVSLDGVITFMTTNVLEVADPALIRAGRVDYIYELAELRHREILQYIDLMFPGAEVYSDAVFEDIMGCDLQKLYFENRHSYDQFIDSIPQKEVAGSTVVKLLRPN